MNASKMISLLGNLYNLPPLHFNFRVPKYLFLNLIFQPSFIYSLDPAVPERYNSLVGESCRLNPAPALGPDLLYMDSIICVCGLMVQRVDNGFEASLDCWDSPGVHYTLHVETKPLSAPGGKNG